MEHFTYFMTYAQSRRLLSPKVIQTADVQAMTAEEEMKEADDELYEKLRASEDDTDWGRVFNALPRRNKRGIMARVGKDIASRLSHDDETFSVTFPEVNPKRGVYTPYMKIEKLLPNIQKK